MKIYLKLMFFAVLLSSCNNMANISKEDCNTPQY
jgi:PBP1b-binding outer membrane lipoprotein LpoB